MKKIEVAIIDDHEVVIDGLVAMLSSSEVLQITYTTQSGRELLGYLETTAPDVLLMDIQMPEISGIELCRQVLQQQQQCHQRQQQQQRQRDSINIRSTD